LCAAPLVGFLPKLFGARTSEPLDRRPTWAQLVVVTCGELPTDLDLSGPGFSALQARAARASVLPVDGGPADGGGSSARSAAVLWSGRSPQAAGGASSIAESAWTLAEAARRTGAATAAFLEAPLVSEASITGFSTVVEDAELGPARLAALAGEHLASHADERALLWLHLAAAGPRGAALEDLLGRLHGVLAERGHRWDALVVVTALTGEDPAAGPVPLWVELPNALYAGRSGRGAADLAELTVTLLEILRLPGPDVTRGEPPLASSSASLATLLQGGAVD
jgi:hypothetical protein